MDWSKAKNIIIAALLVTNLAIGTFYISQLRNDAKAREASVEAACRYLESVGIDIEAEVPLKTRNLPVLFVNVSKGQYEPVSWEGLPVEVIGANIALSPLSEGDLAGSTIGADRALLKLYSQLGEEEKAAGLKVEGVDLVYLLDVRNAVVASQDTAVPSWKISTSRGVYYIEAYSE